jgi:hypothetical protein
MEIPMHNDQDARRFVIRIREKLDPHWSARFRGMELRHDAAGTVLRGVLPDRRALHEVLAITYNLGLNLLSVAEEPVTSVADATEGAAAKAASS